MSPLAWTSALHSHTCTCTSWQMALISAPLILSGLATSKKLMLKKHHCTKHTRYSIHVHVIIMLGTPSNRACADQTKNYGQSCTSTWIPPECENMLAGAASRILGQGGGNMTYLEGQSPLIAQSIFQNGKFEYWAHLSFQWNCWILITRSLVTEPTILPTKYPALK